MLVTDDSTYPRYWHRADLQLLYRQTQPKGELEFWHSGERWAWSMHSMARITQHAEARRCVLLQRPLQRTDGHFWQGTVLVQFLDTENYCAQVVAC